MGASFIQPFKRPFTQPFKQPFKQPFHAVRPQILLWPIVWTTHFAKNRRWTLGTGGFGGTRGTIGPKTFFVRYAMINA